MNGNICEYITDYRWSSARAYWGFKDPLVNTDYAYSLIGSKENLQSVISNDAPSWDEPPFEGHFSQPLYFSDVNALDKFKELSHCDSPADVQRLPKTERNKLIRLLAENRLSYNQIARFCGITKTTVYRVIKCYK